MADRRKLAQGLMMMTPAMREDLSGREQDIQRGKTVELLRRASLPLGKNLTTLDVIAGVSPDEMVEIYRGVPQGVSEISPGDFITTNRQLAQDYAGGGNVISQKVPYRTILDDLTEPLGEEYIYRP